MHLHVNFFEVWTFEPFVASNCNSCQFEDKRDQGKYYGNINIILCINEPNVHNDIMRWWSSSWMLPPESSSSQFSTQTAHWDQKQLLHWSTNCQPFFRSLVHLGAWITWSIYIFFEKGKILTCLALTTKHQVGLALRKKNKIAKSDFFCNLFLDSHKVTYIHKYFLWTARQCHSICMLGLGLCSLLDHISCYYTTTMVHLKFSWPSLNRDCCCVLWC